MKSKVKLGFIGLGYWGKNLFRSFTALPEVELVMASDLSPANLDSVKPLVPHCKLTLNADEIFAAPDIEAIVIATPPLTHVALGLKSLKAGKHTFIEKPLSLDVEGAHELVALAKKVKRTLMVGHLLKHHPVTHHIKKMIERDELGEINYIYSQRLNLGVIRSDENPLWSLSPHDISLILYFLNEMPVTAQAAGGTYLQKNIEDVVFCTLEFGSGHLAHLHLSWLDPHKIRRLTIVGSKKMAVFDDMEPREKLRIYDKGAEISEDPITHMEYLGLREGDIHIPRIEAKEPLRIECKNFVDAIRGVAPCLSDGEEALRILQVIKALDESLKQGGSKVRLKN